MRLLIAFTVLKASDVLAQTKNDELSVLRKTVVYLNDFALKSCRVSRDSLIALTIMQSAISDIYAKKIDSLTASLLKKEELVRKAVLTLESKENELLHTRIALLVLIVVLIITAF